MMCGKLIEGDRNLNSNLFSSAPTCIFLYFYLLFTRFWVISVLYSIWWFFDYDTPSRGGRRVSYLCRLKVWEYMRDYFPVKVRKLYVTSITFHSNNVLYVLFTVCTVYCTLRSLPTWNLEVYVRYG